MSQLLRGTIAVIVLVIVISVGYLVIQNYENRKIAEDSKQKQDQMNSQEQQDIKTKLNAEKVKLDTLVRAMQNHSATEGNTTEKTESPF
ncbi:MAG: hypothetical protein WBL54_07765 [Nitrososphaeraceae archaeon]